MCIRDRAELAEDLVDILRPCGEGISLAAGNIREDLVGVFSRVIADRIDRGARALRPLRFILRGIRGVEGQPVFSMAFPLGDGVLGIASAAFSVLIGEPDFAVQIVQMCIRDSPFLL